MPNSSTPQQKAAAIVLTRVPPRAAGYLKITWSGRSFDDPEGSWVYGTLGTPLLGYLKFRVRIAGGDPRVEMLPVR